MSPIDESLGPGLLGFIVTFALALACIVLFRSMTGHLRKVTHRAASGAVDGQADGDVVADEGGNG
jgi:hypothetical protein